MSADAFLALNGAIAADGAIAHYGAPLAEQRSLDEGNAIVSLAHRGVVTVAGPDRLSWLHSMTSQQLTGLRPGESVETLLLDQQGHILPPLAERGDLYRSALDAEVQVLAEDLGPDLLGQI